MSRLFIGFLLLIFLISCHKEKLPDGVVARGKMVSLLYDFHLAEGYISSLPMDSSRLLARNYYHAVFQKYGIDSAKFHKTLLYYTKQPEVLNQLYEEVQKKMEALQQEEQAKLDKRNRAIFVADSIRNAHVKDSVLRVTKDAINLRWSKRLIPVALEKDTSHIVPVSWSLPVYEAWVGHILFVNGKLEEVNQLLLKRDSADRKTVPKDSLSLKSGGLRLQKK